MPARALTASAASPPPSATPPSGGSAGGPGLARTRAGRPVLGLRTACLGAAAAARSAFPAPPAAAPSALAVRCAPRLRCLPTGGLGRRRTGPLLSVRVRPTPLSVRPVPSSLAPAAVVATRAVEADRLEQDRSLSPAPGGR